MKTNKSILIPILILVFVLLPFTPTIAVPESKKANITLTGITRHDAAMYNAFEDAFKEAHPELDVDIEWLEITTNAGWAKAIKSTTYTVDFCWGGGPTVFTIIANEGLLKPIENENLIENIDEGIPSFVAGVPMSLKDENGDYLWVASALSSFGYTVNQDNRGKYNLPMPKTWQDLGDPEWFLGRTQFAVAMGNAPETTSNTRVYQIIAQAFGWEMGWQVMTMMGGNAKMTGESGPTRDSVITGPQAAAMTIDFYGYQAMHENSDCEYIIPEGQSIINGDPIAITSSCDDLDTTEMFVDFVLSQEAQAIWLDTAFNRLPIREDAFTYAESQGNKRDDLFSAYQRAITNVGIPFNESEAVANYDAFTFYFEATINDVHNELVEAWAEIVDLYLNGDGTLSTAEFRSVIRTMAQPSITAQECIEIQSGYLSNPSSIEAYKSQWKSDARARFTAARNKAATEASDSDDEGEFFSPTSTSITDLEADEVISTDLTVSVEVEDYGDYTPFFDIEEIEFYLDGTLDSVDNSTPYTYDLEVVSLADGPHSLMTMASENFGRLFVDWVNFQVGTTKTLPSYEITLPTGNVTGMSSINGSIGNNAEFTGSFVQLYLLSDRLGGFSLQQGIAWSSKVTSGLDNFSQSLNSTKLPNGEYQVLVVIGYSSGNSIVFNAGSMKTYNIEEETEWKRSPGFLITSILPILALLGLITRQYRKKG